MDLQTRKLKAIGFLINLQDERKLEEIEAAFENVKSTKDLKVKPFTKKQLTIRAQQSNEDYLAGRFKTQEQLERESENW